MHQAGDGCSTPHVALHVLHAGGRLDRHAARIERHALADEGDRLVLGLAAVPLHDRQTRRTHRTLGNAEQRAHAELLHFLLGQDLDLDAELFELLGFSRELDRAEDVGRLVDQVAGKQHAADDGLGVGKGFLGGSRIGAMDGDLGRLPVLGLAVAPFVTIVLLGLVFVEAVAAELDAGGDAGRGRAICRDALNVEDHGHFGCLAQLRCDHAAELQPGMIVERRRLARTDRHEPVDGGAFGRQHLDHTTEFAVEVGDRERTIERLGRIVGTRRIAQPAFVGGKDDDGALLGRARLGKTDRRLRSHDIPLSDPVQMVRDISSFSPVWQASRHVGPI